MSDSIVIETPIGPIAVFCEDTFISAIKFGDYGSSGDAKILMEAKKEIEEYFDGRRKRFTLPLKPGGTDYQKKVWSAALKISYGGTRTYQWISELAGGSPRSAGRALAANPIPIIIPCHRVIKKDGKLGGYSSGIGIKRFLLEHERLHSGESVLTD